MMAFIETILPKFRKVAGVDLYIADDGQKTYHVVLLERKGTKINILRSLSAISDMRLIRQELFPYGDIPVCLSVSGKGVILKRASFQDNVANSMLQLFPGVKPAEFFVQKDLLRDGQIISISRKDQVRGIIGGFLKEGFPIIRYSFGPFSTLSVFNALNFESEIVNFAGHQIIIKENSFWDYSFSHTRENEVGANNQYLQFDKLQIDKKYLVAFSNAFTCLVADSSSEPDEAFSTLISNQEDDFRYKLLFKRFGWAALIISVVLLFANFIFYYRISNVHSELSSSLGYGSAQLEKLNSLNSTLERGQNFLDEAGWTKSHKVSFFSDRIAASLPETVSLTFLSVFPRDKIDRSNPGNISFERGKIKVKGFSADNIHFNKWISSLKTVDLIMDVQVISFKEHVESELDEFELFIIIKS